VTNDQAPLLAAENDDEHPQELATEHGGVRVMLMDSARYCDSRNVGDVVVNASYCGVLPARLIAPHRPRGVVGHDIGIGADGAGIQGLAYLEALGIPAATADATTAELGNAVDMYRHGRISRMNVLAERCGVERGQSVAKACEALATGDPGDTTARTKVRRAVVGEAGESAIVVTDSIVFALEEDTRNVLVTAGHTGRTGARFIEAVSPLGFICADGGLAKGGSGTAGLARLDEVGIPGACYDVMTAAMGDAFDAWERGRISAANAGAIARGVRVGQPVDEAAWALLRGPADPSGPSGSASASSAPARVALGSRVLASGELAGISPKFAEGLARVREVTDGDGELPARIKALFMAVAAAVRHQEATLHRELRRAVGLGLDLERARGASVAALISRGESVFDAITSAIDETFGVAAPSRGLAAPEFPVTVDSARAYFTDYFGSVPPYIELMAEAAPRALEGYVLMRQWSIAENLLEQRYVELLLVAVNAAEFSQRFVEVHARGARRAGATEGELVEAVLCALPISGVASWLPGADGVAASRGG